MLIAHLAAAARSGAGTDIAASTVALITGGAAILGSLLGGSVAGWVNLRGQRTRQEFERRERLDTERRDDALRHHRLRGIARGVRTVFKQNVAILHTTREVGAWWADEVLDLQTFAREEDRILLGADLTPEQWNAIENAELATFGIATVRKTSIMSAKLADPAPPSFLSLDWDVTGDSPRTITDPRRHLQDVLAVINAAIKLLDPICDRSLLDAHKPSVGSREGRRCRRRV